MRFCSLRRKYVKIEIDIHFESERLQHSQNGDHHLGYSGGQTEIEKKFFFQNNALRRKLYSVL